MFKRLFCAFFITILCFSAYFGALTAPTYSNSETRMPTVAIDAGHGGIDGGASGGVSGVKESDINLAIAKKLKEIFSRGGFSVVMTRSGEAGLYGVLSKGFKRRDMEARVAIVNRSRADILISVHLNTFSDSSLSGAQVFYRAGDRRGMELAKCVQNSLNDNNEREKKRSPLAGDYYILNETFIPAVICEYGFLSNPEDEKLLLSEDYQQKIAYSTYLGTLSYFAGYGER